MNWHTNLKRTSTGELIDPSNPLTIDELYTVLFCTWSHKSNSASLDSDIIELGFTEDSLKSLIETLRNCPTDERGIAIVDADVYATCEKLHNSVNVFTTRDGIPKVQFDATYGIVGTNLPWYGWALGIEIMDHYELLPSAVTDPRYIEELTMGDMN